MIHLFIFYSLHLIRNNESQFFSKFLILHSSISSKLTQSLHMKYFKRLKQLQHKQDKLVCLFAFINIQHKIHYVKYASFTNSQ